MERKKLYPGSVTSSALIVVGFVLLVTISSVCAQRHYFGPPPGMPGPPGGFQRGPSSSYATSASHPFVTFNPPPHYTPRRQAEPASMSRQSRQFALPSMAKMSETWGALTSIGKFFLNRAQPNEKSGSSSSDLKESQSQVSSVVATKIPRPHLEVDPSKDDQLGSALYTLGRNVLGKNVTDTLSPMMHAVGSLGRFLPPLIYRDGRIILGSASNATKDGGSIKDVVCTTPNGNSGRCLDLSGCPSLLFDLPNLRKSLCFKALFVPGVCCPDQRESQQTNKPPPLEIITTTRPITHRPPTGIIDNPISTTRRPAFVEPGIPSLDCGKAETPSFRIVGGEKSAPGMWPWMAAIFLHGARGKTEFWCGGSLISKRYILTAAHCTKDQRQKSFSPRQFTVRLGDHDLQSSDDLASPETYNVVEIIAHKEFVSKGFYNDVALLKLDRDVDYSRYISPICLPSGRSRISNFVGTYPTVIGWGTNRYGGKEHSTLQQVNLPVWSNQDCDRAYLQPITDIFLCAGIPQGGKDACQGDSGGPLMLEMDGRWVQIGVVSFGNKCAEPGYPGVYTRITQFLDWIYTNAD